MPSHIATGIYIARGDDTLGPYTPGEAAELIRTGKLLSNDLAARSGDAAWVPLANFLHGEAAPGTSDVPRARPAGRGLWHGWIFVVVLVVTVAALLAVGGPRAARRREIPRPPPSPPPSVASPRPLTALDKPSPPPVNEKNVQLSGAIRLVSADGMPVTLETVRVRAYRLRELTPYLEQKKAAVQAGLDRLAPLIAAAGSARDARLEAERHARQALLDAAPYSDLEASLRFAHDQARAAVQDAESDCRYLRDQRAEVTRGDVYFRDLPDAEATADTDAEGAFTLDLPPGEACAVAACVRQAARTRYWLVKIPAPVGDHEPIVLSDDNEASHGSPESLILTAP